MGLEDASVGEVQPGEHDQLVARLDAVQRFGESWLDLQKRLRCALGLVGGIGHRAERRANHADRVHSVRLGLHLVRKSHSSAAARERIDGCSPSFRPGR